MSTALVSAFYDVGDVLYKDRQRAALRESKKSAAATFSSVGAPPLINHHHQQQPHRRSNSSSSSSSFGAMVYDSANKQQQSLVAGLADVAIKSGGGGRSRSGERRDRSLSENDQNRSSSPPSPNTKINSSRYKTEMCSSFEENGTCKYGDKCQFAHGAPELRSMNRHPKYKTELCRTFHSLGFCPYGRRCHFVHNAEEIRKQLAAEQQQQQQQQSSSANNNNISSGSRNGLSSSRRDTKQQQQQQRPKLLRQSLSFSGSSGSVNDVPTPTLCESPLAVVTTTAANRFFGEDSLASVILPPASSYNPFTYANEVVIPSLLSPGPVSPTTSVDSDPFPSPSPILEEVIGFGGPNSYFPVIHESSSSSPPSPVGGSSSSSSSSLDGDQDSGFSGSAKSSPLCRLPIFSRLSIDD